MTNQKKRFLRNQTKCNQASNPKQTAVNNNKIPDMDTLTTHAKEVARKINYTTDVIDFIEHPSKWSNPTPTPGYALTCVAHKKSGALLKGKFVANTTFQHWSLGEIAVSFGRYFIYPGQKRIYFPVRYLTKDKRQYREIVFFSINHEPTQQEALNLYTALLFISEHGNTNIQEEIGWNTSFLFRPMMEALAVEVLERQLKERKDRFYNITGEGGSI